MIKVIAKKTKNGFLIPIINELKQYKNEDLELEIEILSIRKRSEITPFLKFLEDIYGINFVSNKILNDKEALKIVLGDKYGT